MMYQYKLLAHTSPVDWHGHVFRGNEKLIGSSETIASMAKRDIKLFEISNNKGHPLVAFEMKEPIMHVKVSIARMLGMNPDTTPILHVHSDAGKINHLSALGVLYKWYKPVFLAPKTQEPEGLPKTTIEYIKQKAEELLLLINKMENDKP